MIRAGDPIGTLFPYIVKASRLECLREAAVLMRDHARPVQVSVSGAAVSGIPVQASASWLYPGVVSVLFAGGGFPRLESVAGQPFQLDAESTQRIESWGKTGVNGAAISCRTLSPVLAMAADLLMQRERLPQCRFRFLATYDSGDQHWRDMQAVWHWPGVLRVIEQSTGQLVAQSEPGVPSGLQFPARGTTR